MYCALAYLDDELVVQELDGRGQPLRAPQICAPGQVCELDRRAVRWVLDDVSQTYRSLLHRGVHLRRCHDISTTERILLSRQDQHGLPTGTTAILARTAGEPLPGVVARAASSGATPRPRVPDHTAQDGLFAVAAPMGPDTTMVAAALADQLGRMADAPLRLLVAAESAGALLAVEMTAHGLPWDVAEHERLLVAALGPRPLGLARPVRLQELADQVSAAFGAPVNPDSALEVRRAFQRNGFEISSTRSSVIEQLVHPAVAPLLRYKELSRLFAANGWAWLAEWVHQGRFRPEWSPAAVVTGRWATRGGGGLQIPKSVRSAVCAEPGHCLVVADAAQLEPRVLAALSADRALSELASTDDDLYTALAAAGFDGQRQLAKLAMLGAMYGQTTGEGGRLVPLLRRRYPAAMEVVEQAAREGQAGKQVRSVLGRYSPRAGTYWFDDDVVDESAGRLSGSGPGARNWGAMSRGAMSRSTMGRSQARSWGRFTRNFVVQGSAADWAAVWLATLRQLLMELPGTQIVFFQHDELIVHTPDQLADQVVAAIAQAAKQACELVFPGSPVVIPVRPVVVHRYAEAK